MNNKKPDTKHSVSGFGFGRRDWTRTNDPHHVKVGLLNYPELPRTHLKSEDPYFLFVIVRKISPYLSALYPHLWPHTAFRP